MATAVGVDYCPYLSATTVENMALVRAMWPFIAAFVVAYLLLCAWMYATQRAQIYFPTPASAAPRAKVLWVESAAEHIKVWVVGRPGSSALLYFGGNAEDVAGNVDALARAFPDRSLYLVNYRGFGGSSGRPSEAGLRDDAIAVFDQVRPEHPDIAVIGRSLGSGVAVQLAATRPVERLALVTPYDSLVNVARTHFRWLPVAILLKDRFDSAARAPEVKVPVLIVIAAEDEIIPPARSEALAQAFAPGQVEVVVVPGVGHNTLDLSHRYLDVLRGFLR
jgi:pimeloyl-ACP methyl ester carboxylesterase